MIHNIQVFPPISKIVHILPHWQIYVYICVYICIHICNILATFFKVSYRHDNSPLQTSERLSSSSQSKCVFQCHLLIFFSNEEPIVVHILLSVMCHSQSKIVTQPFLYRDIQPGFCEMFWIYLIVIWRC